MIYIHIMDESLVDFLGNTLLFSGLSREKLVFLSSLATEKTYEKGELVFSEGDEARGFYIVKAGLVRIYKISINGREQTLHLLGRGEPFGEVAVFIGMDYPAYAMALDHSEVLFFPKDRFVTAIRRHPELALAMLAVLSRRLRAFSRMIEDLSLKEVPQRLAAYLTALSEFDDRDLLKREITLHVSKNLLSTILGTSPETISRVFKKLEERGILERKNERIFLKDLEKLHDLADGITKLA